VLQFLQDKFSRLRREIKIPEDLRSKIKIPEKFRSKIKFPEKFRKNINFPESSRVEPITATEEKIFLQYEGREIVVDNILEKVRQEFILGGHNAADIKSIRLYIKPQENAAYYIINNQVNNDNKVSLI
jgi:hypothetical protein